jgi:LuxR family maltose regulon positive regulatory protein
LIDRPVLSRLRTHGLNHKVVSIAAPTGFGKTSLLSQWRSALIDEGIAVAWITLKRADAGPAQILTNLILALAEADKGLGTFISVPEDLMSGAPVTVASEKLADRLSKQGQPIVIMIDDIHHAPQSAVDQALGPLLGAGLSQVRLVVAGRTRPPLSIGNLRARGEVLEIEADDLGFADADIADLFSDLGEADRTYIASATWGWPVALQLARLWIDGKQGKAPSLEGFTGRIPEVADYLVEQVLVDLPHDLLRLLESIALLDAFCEEAVAAVTGSETLWPDFFHQPAIRHLIYPIDQTDTWFRFHPLLSDYLRDQLHRSDPALERQFHERASEWFESKGLAREAASHAFAGGSISRAATLIEDAGGWELVVFGGAALMKRLLSDFPASLLANHPRVALCRALVDAKNGAIQEAKQRLDDVDRALTCGGAEVEAPLSPTGRDLFVTRHLIAGYGDLPIETEALARAHNELAADDIEGRAVLTAAASIDSLRHGDMSKAYAICERGVREMRALGSVLGTNYGYVHLGFASFHLGNRREAEAAFREATELAEENISIDTGLHAIADVGLAVMLTARGCVADARTLFDRSLPLVEAYDGWLDVFAEGYGAAISSAFVAGDFARARNLIERGSITSIRRGLFRLDRIMTAYRCRLAIMTGRLQDARAALNWQKGCWRDDPSSWREHHVHGIAAAELEIACGDIAMSRMILFDLAEAAASGHRLHDGRRIAFLDAIAQFSDGAQEDAAQAVIDILEAALSEEDAEFLVESGALGISLLQYLRQWTLERVASSLIRQAVAKALRRLATSGDSKSQQGIGLLSGRELEVLMELVQGSPNKVIARALQMRENTVKFHLKNIFQKLHVNHRTEAVRVAREQGLDKAVYTPMT